MRRSSKFSSVGIDLTASVLASELYKTNREITSIAVHCSDSPQGRGDDAKTIDRWHLERWGANSGCGYHYVVLEDGTIQKGRYTDKIGSHIKGHNTNTIAICRIGGMDSKGKPILDITHEQRGAILVLCKLLIKLYSLPPDKVLGHNEYPGVTKLCPLMDMNKIRSSL